MEERVDQEIIRTAERLVLEGGQELSEDMEEVVEAHGDIQD